MNILKKISGSIILIGSIDSKYLGDDLTEVYYLNDKYSGSASSEAGNSIDISKSMFLKDLHKHFKNGIDNICANFDEIKNYVPAFLRESLKITKKDIYVIFKYKKDFEFLKKKFKRFNLEIEKYEFDKQLVMKVKVSKTSGFKRNIYYITDSIQRWYNYISENI